MNAPLRQPTLLETFGTSPPKPLRRWVSTFATLWLLWIAADWTCRCTLFHWHRTWLPPKPAATTTASATPPAPTLRHIPAKRGAGLTSMIPVPWIRKQYEEYHPPRDEWVDPDGYPNAPLAEGETWQAALVGDSFMLSLGQKPFAEVLGEIGGIRVLTRARSAAGPFLELKKYVSNPPVSPPPPILIWNLTARELNAAFFLRQPVDSWFASHPSPPSAPLPAAVRSIDWTRLRPDTLTSTLPQTSLTAYFARKAWTATRLLLFRTWPHDVLGADDPQYGPILFYRENLRYFAQSDPADAKPIASVVARVSERLCERGITLIVLLVPEKEQLHLTALPSDLRRAITPSLDLLAALAADLRARGIPTINPLPSFQTATASGTRLYWRDDPHWNDAAIHLAAEIAWHEIALQRHPAPTASW